jgi:hypothetical protein
MALTLQDMVEHGAGFESHLALWAPFPVIGDAGGLAAAQRTQ